MDPNRDKAAKEIFASALEKEDAAAWARYLAEACAGDEQLRQEVESLLQAHTQAGGFLQPTPAQSTVQIIAEGPGTIIGRYKLREKIGEGGCGIVYVAEQEEPVRRKVALKIIKLGMDTRDVIARFEAERQALALMDHPNIARVFDGGATDTGRPYFVMELVKGIKITEYCDQNNLSTRQRLDLFIQVCHAIQHAHQKGIIHRDIKPSNVLVSRHDDVPVPKVIDFGIAKAMGERLSDKTLYTSYDLFMGTPAYMSPEQTGLSDLDIDTRSDIYSLGVLLYELLTGKTPFDARELLKAGLDELLRTIREKEPVRPSTRLRQTSIAGSASPLAPRPSPLAADLDWIVMKCLEKNRARRYETANALAQDIENHLSNQPVTARPPSTVYRVQKFVRRNKVIVTATALVATALVLGVAVSTWQAVRATSAEREQSRQRQRAEENEQKAKANELATRQQAYAADMSLAQQALAMNDLGRARRLLGGHRPRRGESDLRGWEWRYLWQQCRSDALGELCRYSNSVFEVAYAPDGKTLAVAGPAQNFVELWNVPGRRRIATLQTNAGHLVAFSTRGDLLATDTAQGGINIWRVGTTNLVRQLTNPDGIKFLKFSPDGTRLASLNYRGEVAVWEVDGWTVIRRIPGTASGVVHEGRFDFSPDGKALVIGQQDGKLRVVDVDSGRTNFNITAHPEYISAVAWSPKAAIVASGSFASLASGGPMRLWDAVSGKSLGALEGHTSWISELIFSADGQRLYSASADQTIRIWDVSQQRCLATLRGSSDDVWGLGLSPDGTTLASGSKDGVVAFWSALPHSKEEQPRVLPMGDDALGAAFAPESRVMAVPRQGMVRLYELPALREVESIAALGTNVSVAACSPDGTLIVSGSTDGWLRVWSGGQRRLLQELPGRKGGVSMVRFSTDGTRLLAHYCSARYYGTELICWDTRGWQTIWSLPGQLGGFPDVSPDGRLAVVGSIAGKVNWYDTASGRLLAAAFAHHGFVSSIAFAPDGTRAASIAEEGAVALWDASSFQVIATFKGFMHGAHGVAFSPDGRRLATGGSGREAVKLWDLSTQRELVSLAGQGMLCYFLAFSPDGNWLAASTWAEGRLHLWRAPSWAEIEAAEAKEKEKDRAQ